ncbi:FAD-dependent oxidoreductase, partial [Neobacillus vireti]|uniref:FAD-dependent oxidoreductase n=1 Tax=Neobacillus vireti TaxID=220686 RepID=UPI002FFE375A
HVTVYDKGETLGGTFGVIATGPFEKRIRDLITWYGVQLNKLNVEVNLNTEINVDDSILEAADKIFVGTGAIPFVPNIPGIESPHVLGVVDAHKNGVQGEKVVVCGGGMSGCDTALELALEGKQVTIVEMLSECARDVMVINKISLMRQLAENNVTLLTYSKVVSIDETGVTIEKKDGTVELVAADTVITAFGQKPSTDFPDAVRKQYNIKTTVIGDAEKVSKAANAIHTGFYAAMAVE